MSKSRGQAPQGPAAASLLVLVVLALLLTSACAHPPAAAPASGPALGERFTLRAGESASIRGERATIVFDRIVSDSRCAVDVQCIRAGEARAALRLEPGGGPEISFELDTDRDRTSDVRGYRITLVGVFPAPRSTVRIPPSEYRVELTISH